jgi:hypothetical protein
LATPFGLRYNWYDPAEDPSEERRSPMPTTIFVTSGELRFSGIAMSAAGHRAAGRRSGELARQ